VERRGGGEVDREKQITSTVVRRRKSSEKGRCDESKAFRKKEGRVRGSRRAKCVRARPT
jgi:hypothetical protein